MLSYCLCRCDNRLSFNVFCFDVGYALLVNLVLVVYQKKELTFLAQVAYSVSWLMQTQKNYSSQRLLYGLIFLTLYLKSWSTSELPDMIEYKK